MRKNHGALTLLPIRHLYHASESMEACSTSFSRTPSQASCRVYSIQQYNMRYIQLSVLVSTIFVASKPVQGYASPSYLCACQPDPNVQGVTLTRWCCSKHPPLPPIPAVSPLPYYDGKCWDSLPGEFIACCKEYHSDGECSLVLPPKQ